jgi:membrane-associated phospholipid phosphatase
MKVWEHCQHLRWGLSQLPRAWWADFALKQAILLLAAWWIVHPMDDLLISLMKYVPGLERYDAIREVARWISWVGDYPVFTLGSVGLLAWLGKVRGSVLLRRLAVTCLISATLAGSTALAFRMMLGRPRPFTGMTDGFYGPSSAAVMHSCPSGHTATAFATAIPMLICLPRCKWLGMGLAIATGASRVELRQHRPTDVLIAIWEACGFAIPLGLACRRARE